MKYDDLDARISNTIVEFMNDRIYLQIRLSMRMYVCMYMNAQLMISQRGSFDNIMIVAYVKRTIYINFFTEKSVNKSH